MPVYNHGYTNFNPNPPYHRKGPNNSISNRVRKQSKTKTIGGVAGGFGIEYAITPNILLRAEYQYVLFQDFNGHKSRTEHGFAAGPAVKF